jgi:hypothetical protein
MEAAMACHEFKIAVEYLEALEWEVTIWRREVLVYRERGPWQCILSYKTPTLEGHLDSTARLRQVMRSLA